MNEDELNSALTTLVSQKKLKVENKNHEDNFSLTEKGLNETVAMIKGSEDCQLELFCLVYRLFKDENPQEDNYKILAEAITAVKGLNPNFMKVLYKGVNEGKIQGLTIKREITS